MLSAITAGSGIMGYTLTAAIGGRFMFVFVWAPVFGTPANVYKII